MGTSSSITHRTDVQLATAEQGAGRAKIAQTIPSTIEYYEFNNQPREQWPKWLQTFATIPDSRAGLIATAHCETDDGEPEWWRWFEPQVFFSQFQQVP